MSLRVLAICVFMLIAGCTGVPIDNVPEEHSTSTVSQEHSTSTEPGELPTFTEPGVMPGGRADLDIDVLGGQPIRVTIEELGERGRGIVLDETYSDEYTLDFGDNESLFLKHGTYRVTIRVNGSVQWNETITHWEAYDLRVEENGSVTVTGHAVA